jgi:hypothetical protein
MRQKKKYKSAAKYSIIPSKRKSFLRAEHYADRSALNETLCKYNSKAYRVITKNVYDSKPYCLVIFGPDAVRSKLNYALAMSEYSINMPRGEGTLKHMPELEGEGQDQVVRMGEDSVEKMRGRDKTGRIGWGREVTRLRKSKGGKRRK